MAWVPVWVERSRSWASVAFAVAFSAIPTSFVLSAPDMNPLTNVVASACAAPPAPTCAAGAAPTFAAVGIGCTWSSREAFTALPADAAPSAWGALLLRMSPTAASAASCADCAAAAALLAAFVALVAAAVALALASPALVMAVSRALSAAVFAVPAAVALVLASPAFVIAVSRALSADVFALPAAVALVLASPALVIAVSRALSAAVFALLAVVALVLASRVVYRALCCRLYCLLRWSCGSPALWLCRGRSAAVFVGGGGTWGAAASGLRQRCPTASFVRRQIVHLIAKLFRSCQAVRPVVKHLV